MDNLVYQPLPGRGFGLFRRDRVWLAEDHLLSVRSSRFVDIYERFYFRDIHGIHFRERAGEYWMILIAFLLPCHALVALSILHHWAWGIPLAPLGAWTLTYALFGSQAECQVQTSLGLHPVPAISRRPSYDALREKLFPRIEAAQAELEMQPASTVPPPLNVPLPRIMPAVIPEPNRGWYFEGAFSIVALAAIFSLWNQRGIHGVAFDWLEYGLSLATFVSMLVALARAYRVDVGGGVLACLWSIIVTQAIYGSGMAIAASVQNTIARPSRSLDHHPIRVLPDLLFYSTAADAVCITAAVVGTILIMARKKRQLE